MTRVVIHNGHFYYYCPGCEHAHSVAIDGSGGENRNWTFDGNMEAPTLQPSIKSSTPAHSWTDSTGARQSRPERVLCHHWLKGGWLDFLSDSGGHKLRGHVQLPHFPRGYAVGGQVLVPAHEPDYAGDMHGDTAPDKLVCLVCLKPGHSAADCPQGTGRRPGTDGL